MTPKKKPPRKPVATRTTEGRKKSKLTLIGDEAAAVAKRGALLSACDAHKWNLTRVAETMDMVGAPDVIRALKELAPAEYAAARARGDVATRRDSKP